VHRLIVAVTALLVMVGTVVVVGYLVLFTASTDRAARAAPADAAIYLNVYLQPSSGQKMNLLALVEHLPGFGDAATVEDKIDEVAQRLLGQAGIDYGADLRSWLGTQVAFSIEPASDIGGASHLLVLAVVRDPVAARDQVPRLMARGGASYERETYRGHEAMIGEGMSYALLDDLLLVADGPEQLRGALDANADAVPSLADSAGFVSAMRTVPADHIASLFLNLGAVAPVEADGRLGGYSTAALALTAGIDGLHLDGSAPFASHAASAAVRSAFALGSERASLTDWMPRGTRAELVAFGLQQSLADLELLMSDAPAFADALGALDQLRAIAALGLGINVDRDLLSLFDGEAALAIGDLDLSAPHGQLLLHPSDAAAAQRSLDDMRDALVERGSTVTTSVSGNVTITSVVVPQIGRVAYAMADGVVLLGLDPSDVAAALEAHRNRTTLLDDDRYRSPFELTPGHAGNEFWAEIPGLTDAAATIFNPGSELRDILHQIGELAVSASASGDRLEIHGVLTVK
jgi:hypothetical protein